MSSTTYFHDKDLDYRCDPSGFTVMINSLIMEMGITFPSIILVSSKCPEEDQSRSKVLGTRRRRSILFELYIQEDTFLKGMSS